MSHLFKPQIISLIFSYEFIFYHRNVLFISKLRRAHTSAKGKQSILIQSDLIKYQTQ